MGGGCIDIYTSRRDYHDRCRYWKRDDTNVDLEEYAHEIESDGTFYAKFVSPFTLQKQVIGGMFMFDEQTVTIETNDVVDIRQGNIVEYDEELWNVINVQELPVKKNRQFLKVCSNKTYIQLKR